MTNIVTPIPPISTADGTRQAQYPPPDRWDDWVEYDPKAWPKKSEREYMLIPTVCFNCEAACGLLGWVDKETRQIRKFEGNPAHVGSRGRNCAKGPATLNQINDPDRILYPLKRVGKRGEGKWKRVSWDEVLDELAARIRKALQEERHNELMYHVGRPGEDGYVTRVLNAWGIDGHNSHTNICSAGARAGYFFWGGFDRPSPDHANADVILLISAHLETGHYFNPHAQRIIEGKLAGAKLIVLDTRLSNTASMANHWLSPWPGSEAAMLLAWANYLMQNDACDWEFVRKWVNWEEMLAAIGDQRLEIGDSALQSQVSNLSSPDFEVFKLVLKSIYAEYSFEFAAEESGVEIEKLRAVGKEIARCNGRLSAHVWRSAAAGNLGGWQVARCLWLLNVLTGSVGNEGGTSPSSWNKFVPAPFDKPPAHDKWNELAWPDEYPLAFYEMSFLLPHFLMEGRGKLDTYFTRVYNPMWINPDGFVWLQALQDEDKIGCHVALTPIWSESAWWADYVLPMGLGAERHDLMSQETHSGQWIAFRQPVMRVAMEKMGEPVEFTYEANPGQVWEENEFWIQLSWRIDPDGSLGIRKHFESPYRPGECVTVEEYYQWIFENSVPGLPEAAAAEGLTALKYMRKYGSFEVKRPGEVYKMHEEPVEANGAQPDKTSGILKDKDGSAIGVMVDGEAKTGWKTPSRKLELYSSTLAEWGWPEYTLPGYIYSHVHRDIIQQDENGILLLPTFRLPTLIHTRSGNAKWLYEISHSNPTWMHPSDAERFGLQTGDLLRVRTEIGYFVDKVWITEGIRPGVIACSHHLGRWRLHDELGVSRWSSGVVDLNDNADGSFSVKQLEGIKPFKSDDPDSERIWWSDAGVNQNLTHAVHPDPISGMQCWHQRAWIEPVETGDHYGDIYADTNKSMEIYHQWLDMARPPTGDLRRPLWLNRPLRPQTKAFQRA